MGWSAISLDAATTINAVSCSQQDVQAAVNQASTGDIVTIPLGNCTWSNQLILSVGITLQGQGIGNTIIRDAVPTNNTNSSLSPLISWTCVNNASHRLTGIEFQDGGRTPVETNGIIRFRCVNLGATNVRVDHNKFDHLNGDMLTFNTAVGVTDHNTFLAKQNEIPIIVRDENWNAALGQDGTGDFSWSGGNPVSWGSDQFMFIEDNTITFDPGAKYICNDGFSGARVVLRFNTTSGCTFEVHGTESSNRQRGTRAVEIYKNTVNGINQTNIIADIRSGTALIWGNTGANLQTPARAARLDNYRAINGFAPFGGADGQNPWDINDPRNTHTIFAVANLPAKFQVSVAGAPWAANQLVGAAIRKTSSCTATNCFALITSNTPNTITYVSSSAQGFGSDVVFAAGDSFEINRVTTALDQPGRGGGSLVSGVTPKAPASWNDQYNDPIYQWLNTGNGVSVPLGFDASCSTCRPNEHYYDYYANFDGSAGVGAGPISSRPNSCTVGVWYWAKDEGEWWTANAGPDGHAYECTGTNTWSVAYTPYTYPHPLTTGASGSTGTTGTTGSTGSSGSGGSSGSSGSSGTSGSTSPSDTTPPSVTVTAPSTGITVSGKTVTVKASATDNVAVASVQFRLDGVNLGTAITGAPYSITWDTTTTGNGAHVLTAIARDTSNNQKTAASINLNVSNTGTTASTVSISVPVNGAKVSGTSVTATATVSSSLGSITSVQFVLDGTNLGQKITSSPYSMKWDSTGVSNGSHSMTAVVSDSSGKQTTSQVVKVTVDNPSYIPYSVSDLGAESWSLTNKVSQAVQYARIKPDVGTAPPAAFAVFGYTSGGVLTSETGLRAAAPVTSGRVFVEQGDGVRTGVSFANPSAQDTVVSFYFTDENGDNTASGSVKILANHQLTAFLDQQPFNGPPSILGTFTFNASPSGVSAIALRTFTNASGEMVTTIPVASLAQTFGNTQVAFPHFSSAKDWGAEVVLINPTNVPISGTLKFYSPGSATGGTSLIGVPVGNGVSSTMSYSIPQRSQFHIMANTAGWVSVIPDTNNPVPAGFALVSSKNAQGVVSSQTSIPTQRLLTATRTYVEASGIAGQNGSIRTNIGLLNPSSSGVTVQLDLRNLDGTPTGLTTSINVPASGFVSQAIDQLFPKIPVPFTGVLRMLSAKPINSLAMRGRYNQRGDFLMTNTPPSDEMTVPSGLETELAYIPSGGGYITQIVIFPGSQAASGNGTLWFVSNAGKVAAVSGTHVLQVLP